MSETLANPHPLLFVLAGAAGFCTALLLSYFVFLRPLQQKMRSLLQQQELLSHASALTQSDWQHKVAEREREIEQRLRQLQELQLRNQTLEQSRDQAQHQATRLQERLGYFTQLEERQRQQEARIIELSQQRTQLQTELRSEEHTSELQSRPHLVCRLLLEKKKKQQPIPISQQCKILSQHLR